MTRNAELVTGNGKDPVVKTCDRDLVEHENDLVHDMGAIEPFSCSHASSMVERIPASTVSVHNG